MEGNKHRHAGGKSSFRMIDADTLYGEIPLKPGSTFLDLGCGRGEYSLEAAKRLGDQAKIIAVDQWAEGIELLNGAIQEQGLHTLETFTRDVTQEIPAKSASVDVCLMSNVLHGFVANDETPQLFKELKRIMKPGSCLAVIEWKKQEGPPGPAREIRLAVDEVEALLQPIGFFKKKVTAVGENFDLMIFEYSA